MSNQERASESHIPAIDGAIFDELAVSAYVASASDEVPRRIPRRTGSPSPGQGCPRASEEAFQAGQPTRYVIVIDTSSDASDAQHVKTARVNAKDSAPSKQSYANETHTNATMTVPFSHSSGLQPPCRQLVRAGGHCNAADPSFGK